MDKKGSKKSSSAGALSIDSGSPASRSLGSMASALSGSGSRSPVSNKLSGGSLNKLSGGSLRDSASPREAGSIGVKVQTPVKGKKGGIAGQLSASSSPTAAHTGGSSPSRGQSSPLRGQNSPLRDRNSPLRGQNSPSRAQGSPSRAQKSFTVEEGRVPAVPVMWNRAPDSPIGLFSAQSRQPSPVRSLSQAVPELETWDRTAHGQRDSNSPRKANSPGRTNSPGKTNSPKKSRGYYSFEDTQEGSSQGGSSQAGSSQLGSGQTLVHLGQTREAGVGLLRKSQPKPVYHKPSPPPSSSRSISDLAGLPRADVNAVLSGISKSAYNKLMWTYEEEAALFELLMDDHFDAGFLGEGTEKERDHDPGSRSPDLLPAAKPRKMWRWKNFQDTGRFPGRNKEMIKDKVRRVEKGGWQHINPVELAPIVQEKLAAEKQARMAAAAAAAVAHGDRSPQVGVASVLPGGMSPMRAIRSPGASNRSHGGVSQNENSPRLATRANKRKGAAGNKKGNRSSGSDNEDEDHESSASSASDSEADSDGMVRSRRVPASRIGKGRGAKSGNVPELPGISQAVRDILSESAKPNADAPTRKRNRS